VQEINLTWHWGLYKAGKYILQAECSVLECESCGKYSKHWAIKDEDYIQYILESNPHSVFGDFLNGKKLVCDSNPDLSFNRPLPTGQLID
jgi:hypothetical protein